MKDYAGISLYSHLISSVEEHCESPITMKSEKYCETKK